MLGGLDQQHLGAVDGRVADMPAPPAPTTTTSNCSSSWRSSIDFSMGLLVLFDDADQ
jgi:hypothetical protein